MSDERLELIPFHSLGPLKFGMSRQRVRELLGPGFSEFLKDPEDPTTSDVYEAKGLFLYYDAGNTLNLVEAVPPCLPTFRGRALLGKPASEILASLEGLGVRGEPDDVGSVFKDHGFGLLLAPEDRAEGASFWKKGYYDT